MHRRQRGLSSVLSVNHGSAVFAEIKVAFHFFLLLSVNLVLAVGIWTLHWNSPLSRRLIPSEKLKVRLFAIAEKSCWSIWMSGLQNTTVNVYLGFISNNL